MKTNRLFLHLTLKRKQKNAVLAAAKSRKPSALAGSIAMLAASAFMLGSAPKAKAANFWWDPLVDGNSLIGGTGTWDITNPLFDPTGLDTLVDNVAWINGTDIAIFGGTAGTVTLGVPITAGGLTFTTSGYDITGGTLTLTPPTGSNSPTINVNGTGSRATISSILAGSSGFLKTGDGSLVLTNSSNTYTGDTVINGGSVVITNQGQLGLGTTAISIGGIANTGNPGFSGGQLVLNGIGGAITISREISISGRGPGAANNGGGLISVGNNIIAGHVVLGGPASQGNIVATHGITTISGNVQLGNASTQTLFGNGNYIVTGQVTGFEIATDRFAKSGQTVASTLWLQNATNNFAESLRIDTGTVRVSTSAALGNNISTQAVDLNNGTLEIRTDAPDFANRKVFIRDNTTGTILIDRAIGGTGLNQTVAFNELRAANINNTFTINGRDGYNASFIGINVIGVGPLIGGGGNNNTVFNNNLNGVLTLNANLWNQADGSARVLTLQGNAETVVTGNILRAGGGAHIVNKGGTGTLTLQGTAGTFTGSFSINAGTTQVTSIGAFNATGPGALQLNNGALDYRGTGETRTKLLNLSGTTAPGIILANQPSGTGLVFNGNPVGGAGLGNKTLFLGGGSTSTIINEIGGVIANSIGNTTSLAKIGGNTWLYDPAAATYTAGTTQTTGAAASAITTNVITLAAANAGIVVGQAVTGTNIPAGSVVTSISGTTLTISNNIATAVTAATTLTFGATSNFVGSVTVAGGTLQVRPTAASGSGSDAINNTSALIFNVDALTGNQWAGGTFEYQGSAAGGALNEALGVLTPTAGAGIVKVTANGGTPSLTFSGLAAGNLTGTGLNFVTAGPVITVTGASNVNGIVNAHAYFNGGDFAASTAGVIGAATYNAFAGGATLAGANTLPYLLNGDVTAQTTATINAGIKVASGPRALTLAAGQTLTLQNGAATVSGGILVTGGNSLTISGGTGITSGGAADLVFRADTAADTITLSTPILASTTGGFTKNGLGTLVLNAVNLETAAGTINVNQGTLQLSGATTTLGANNMNLNLRQGTTLDVNGVNISSTAVSGTNTQNLNSLNGAGTITNSAGTGTSTITIGNNAGSGVFSGIIQDGATAKIALIKANTGTESLIGVNTYTGITQINGGTLAVNSLANIGVASSIGRGDNTSAATNAASLVFNGAATGTLQYTGANATFQQATQTPSISINRLFTLAGNGIIDSSGQYGNSVLAAGNANNAALIFNNTTNGVAFSGAVSARTLTLQGNSAGDNEMGIQLAETGGYTLGLTKAGTGLWIVGNAANNYSLPTTITGGQLQTAPGNVGLPGTSALRLAGGVYQTSGTFTRAFGTLPGQVAWSDAAGTAINQNGGFSASNAKLTVNFGGANAGVQWGASGIGTGTGTLILNSVTALADVEITNPIDFNGALRTVQVDDNTTTGLDFATLSGVLSNSTGTGGLIKSGAGNLILGDANTYNGSTTINQGALIVSSIGALNATATSIGTNVSGGALFLGNATTTAGLLLYVGPGETTTRTLNINQTTGSPTIDSSGSGALVLTSIVNNLAGAKTLNLRGTNTDGNTVTSTLADNTGLLTVTKSDGGVWILNPSVANTFTGNINPNGGLLGLTANGIGTAGNITISNGGIFAYGGDLTSSTNVVLANNSTAVFAGQNNITFNGTLTKGGGVNDQTFSNNLENGKVLTFNGNFIDAEATAAATRTINIRGYGSTTFNGIVQNNTAGTAGNQLRLDIRVADTATVTLGGDNKAAALGFTGGILLGQGTLLATNAGAFGPAANTLILDGGTLSSTVDLTGANKIVNRVTLQGDQVTLTGSQSMEFGGQFDSIGGNRFLRNELDPGKTLTISGTFPISGDTNARTLTLRGTGTTIVSAVISNGSTAASNLQYSGLSTLSLTNTNTATGSLTVNRNTISLSGAGSWAGSVVLNPIGIVTLDNSAGTVNRLADAGAITGQGGTLNIIGAPGGTSEVMGALTLNSVQSYITTSGGAVTATFASVNFANSGSSLNLAGVPSLGTTNKVIFTAAPSGATVVFNGMIPRLLLGATDFAQYDAVNGVKAFTAYNNANNLNTAATTDTLNLTASSSITANRTINAIKIDGTAGTVSVGGSAGRTLTVTSGGVINAVGNNSLDTPFVNFTNTPFIQVASGTTLTVNSTLLGGTTAINFSKASGGTLAFNTPSFITGTHNLLNGTTKLISGGLNTFFPNQLLNINDGATLDLNGGTQYFAQLTDPGILPEAGGTITSLAGTGTIVTNMNPGSTTFATNINGNVNFGRVGGNTLSLESINTYSGSTTLLGGSLQLQDDATILNTSSIDINAATLLLNNNASLQRAVYNRVGDTTPIALRDGTLQFNGKVSDPSFEVFGALTSAQGANAVNVFTGGTGTAGAFVSADVTFASLARNGGTTVNFSGSNLGEIGNNARIYFTAPLTSFAGGVLGGWAIANTTDYAAYNTVDGVGVVGSGAFAGYDNTFGSGKVTQLGTLEVLPLTTTLAANTTSALLKLNGNFTNNIAFAAGTEVLNTQLGGILRSNNIFDSSIGTVAKRGVLTAGGTEVSGPDGAGGIRDLVIYNTATGNPSFVSQNVATASIAGSPVVQFNSTQGLQPGLTISNANFPAGTTIVSVDSLTQVTLSNNANTTAQNQTFLGGSFVNGVTTSGLNTVTTNSTTGIAPGMTITGTGIPAGTFVVSVNSPTGLTLSQNATANGSALTFTLGVSNLIVNSVVADNGFGNKVRLVKSGAGIMNLSANNTHTGGTVVDQGTLNLIGTGTGGYVIPAAGGLLIGGATVIMNTNAGQIDPTTVVTIRRSSTFTLTGNNTLDSINFDNNGGTSSPVVNVGAGNTLTLTNSNPVSVLNMDALTVPTISAGTLALGSGAKTISVQGPTIAGQLYTKISPSLNITSVITGSGPITKSDTGVLQVSGQSTFSGLTISDGGILISGNSTPTQGGGGLTSGPLGVGQVTMASGTVMLVDGTRSIGNDISFSGVPTFDSTANVVWTLNLNGSLTGAGMTGPTPTINVINPFLTVALLGKIPNIGSITSFNKTGAGTLVFNSTGYTGDYNATALGNPNQVQLLNDGDGTGSVQTIALGNVVFDPGIVPNIIVGRAGGSLPYPLAANKILAPASVNNVGLGITVTSTLATGGYGLQVSDAIAFSGTPTINVGTAITASNVTQGLYLTGDLTGSGFNKTGAGTVVINNATPANNTFTGNINVTQGVLSVGVNGELGNAANLIVLNPSTGTSAFRATGTFATSRVIQLANTANTRAIEVSGTNTLTLNSALDVSLAASASLNKQELGTLVFNTNNPTWTGTVNITEGAILVNNPALTTPLGTGTINANPAAVFGSALQLAGGVTVSNPLTLQLTANLLNAGINFQGALDNVSGTNTYSGPIAHTFDSTIGARAGSTLNITGLITATGAHRLQFNAEGDINPSGGETGALFGFDKYGAGTLNITTALFGGAISGSTGVQVHNGTLKLSGAGTTNSTAAVNLVYNSATLTLDNSGTNTPNRLTGRAVTLQGGTFNFLSNNSTETAGAFISDQGANTVINGGSGTSALTFASYAGNAGSSLNVTGTFGTATNFLKFTANPALTPVTTGILNRVTVNGNELASYSASLGVVPFTNYSPATNILSATPTSTYKATGATINSVGASQTINALTINGATAVGGLNGNPGVTLTLTSGTILANGSGGAFLNTPIVAFGGAEGIIHVQSGQSLTLNSGLSGTGGLSKDLGGELDVNVQQFVSGTHYINGGTVKLTSTGVTNPLLFNQGMAVNGGGTLDLNGNNQFVAGLSSATAGGGNGIVGGSVINSGAGQSTFTINGNTNFAGVISGNIYLNKTGTGALNLQNAQTYTGATLLTGGTTTLNDMGALPNTSQPIDINFATLSLANGNLYNVNDRVSDTAPITLRGGGITIVGRQQFATTETLGALILADAFNAIVTNAGGTNVNSLDVTAASLTRTGATATVRFNATGQLGSSARLIFTTAPTLTNNILGPWAVVDREYASYDATYGIGALNGTGFAGYSGNSIFTSSGTDNIRFTAAGTTMLAANTTVGTLNFAGQTTATVLNLGGFTLTSQTGGILFNQGTDNIDFSITNGSITSGTLNNPSDLYLTHANFGGTARTVTLGAPIVNNGTGAVRVVFTSGQVEAAAADVTNVNALNLNTGGTIINSGNVVIGATGALGTGGLTVNQGTLTQTAGGVIPASNALTLGGSSLVTLANQANSLAGITINNLGGAAPTLTPTGTLTLTSGITVTTVNAGNPAAIGTGTLDLNGAGSFAINAGAAVINGVNVAPWQSALTINSLIQNGGIAKSGAGMLQLTNALSTFAGGINVSGGGLVIGASSFGPNLGDTLVSGPLGTGAVTMAANTTLVSTGNFSVTNNFTFLGDSALNGTNSLTLNGNTTLPSVWNVSIPAPGVVLTIGNVVGSASSDTATKSGLGSLSLGNYAGTILVGGGGALIFTADGNGLGTPENINLGGNVVVTSDTSITVNRSGGAPNARNKTLQKVNLTDNGSIVSVSNLNGYGLEFTGTTSFSAASTLIVANATASNVVQGLTLSGVVSDTGGYTLVKAGPGTLALTNSGNTFGGLGATIDVLAGVLSTSSNGALGNINNSITLDGDALTGTAFRATGTDTTSRAFILNAANTAFEVTAGNVFTLATPFTLSAPTNALIKNDNGVLEIAANNSTMTGAITINAGAIRIGNANAIGSGTLTINNAVGSAFQLTGGTNYATPITFNIGASGLDSRGVIESVSGNNTISGLVTQNSGFAIVIGASGGSTLNINGGITASNSTTFNAGAGSIINLNSIIAPGGPGTNKIGAGTLNVTVNQTGFTGAINVNQGTMSVAGSGVTLGATGLITVNANGTLNVDDSVGAASTHLGGRAVTLQGGTFNYIGNSANSAETAGILTFAREGGIFTSNQSGAGTVSLTFASLALGGDATANFQGVNLGTATNKILFTTAPTLSPVTTGILSRATVNGSTFATYGANGIAGFTAYNATSTTNINTAAATDTVDANAAMTTKNLTATKTINALRLSGGTAQTVGGAAFNQLVLTAGGVLATGAATHVLSVPVLANAAVQDIFHVDSGSTLNVTSTLTGTAGFVKDGAGTLVLSSPATNAGIAGVNASTLTGVYTIARGTLQLNGGTNTLNPNQFIVMGGPGATLDLNGNSQQILGLLTDTTQPGSGGVVTSSTGTGQLVMNQDTRIFAGSYTGSLNLVKSGAGTLTLVTASSQTGTTLINGGTVILQSDANLGGTTAIDLNYATLSADNNAGLNDLTNRINNAAGITLRGGTLTVQGRAQAASSEALGTVSVNQGFNVINPLVGGTGINSIDVSLASLSRPAGSSATLIVQGTNLGTIGSNSRVTVGTLNGVATQPITYSPNGSGLTNNLVGGWAENGNDFLTYIPGLGFAALNQVGAPQYDLNNTFVAATGTDNVRLTATTNIAAPTTVNAVSMTGSAINLTFTNAGDTLNITSGGLIGPNSNQTIGATVDSGRVTAGGLTPAASSDLYVFNRANTLTINSRIIDNVNGGTSRVRSVFTASGGAISLTDTNNSYTGGTVVNGGTLNLLGSVAGTTIPAAFTPADGLVINNGTVTMGNATNNFAGQIAASNIVTMNGVSNLNLFGNNTLEGLVLNNIGGGSGNLQINTFSTATATGAGSMGVLTIGNAGIVATSSNVSSATIIVGRVDFGATAKTVQVDPIRANGVDIAPLNSAFILQGVTGTTGGITKTGNGVLQFNAQALYTGPTTVNAGGIRIGVTNAGSRLSALTLNGTSTSLNLAGASTTWGSLAGSGTVYSSAGTPTLTVGFDNTSTTFSGQLARFNDAVINGVTFQKIGTGVMSMTSAQAFASGTTGAITVNGGTLRYVDSGEAFNGTAASGATTINLNNGGTIALDNSGAANVNSRLGLDAIGTLNVQGGKLTLNGSSTAATPTTETITTFNVVNGGGRVELTADPANPLTLAITTLNAANGTGSLVIGGITGAASANGVARLTITTPNLITGQGVGANGSTTMAVRHDILADASVSGLGTGFLVKDSVTNNYRALASSELAAAIALPLTTDVDPITAGNQAAGVLNVGLVGATQALIVNSVANTLTISGTSTVNSGLGAAFGNYGPGGNLLGLTLSNAASSLTLAGATGNINVGNFGSTTTGTTIYSHVITGGTLNVNGFFGVGNTSGFLKADGGTFNLNNKAYYTGATTVNDGTLSLNSGAANTLAVVPTTGAPTVSQVNLNGTGAVLDLNAQNQTIGALTSVNPLPGQGGTVTSTGAATLTTVGTGTFGGSITGAVALTRAGNSTTTLTNANTYTGATIVRGGTLELRDSGTLSSTAGLTLNYGTLNWNNFGLNPAANPNPTRVAAANPVTLLGGTFTINGAGSTDTVATLNSVTIAGGANTINTLPFINEGSTVQLTIGNLQRTVSNHSGVNFNGFTTNNSGGSNTLGGQGLTTNGNIFINQLNGAAYSASNLVNNLIGGWAVADGSTFATYSNTFGVVAMGNAYGGFAAPAFTGTDISLATVATGNYNDGGNRTLTTGVKAANSWRFAPGAAQTITPVAGTSYTLGTGMITNAGFSTTIAAVDASNTLTGTGSDLFFYINQNTAIINTAIIGSASLVSNGGGTLRIAPLFASNTYAGGTFINAGTTNLQANPGFVAIPAGGLTINNATVTLGNATAGQIDATNAVTINGGGVLNLFNYTSATSQNLASLTFNNEGGTGAPTFAFGTPTALSTITLTAANAITVTNNSQGTTPLISTAAATFSALTFSDLNPVITVNGGLAETGLNLGVPVTGSGGFTSLTKSGTGLLAITRPESTFTTGFNLAQGGLMFGAASTGSPVVTSGPVGTGTLTIAGGTSVLSDGTIRTIANATTVNGDFTFGGVTAGNGLILSGAMNLGAAGRTLTVTSPANTSTISGAITSTATGTALTKAGAGTLVLSNATSNLGGASVAVTGGILRSGISNAIPNLSALSISAGAGLDLASFGQISQQITGAGFITNSANSVATLVIGGTAAVDAVTNVSSSLGVTLTDNILAQANSRLALTKSGLGTLNLTVANNHSGVTTVNNGILSISNGGALGTFTGNTVVTSGASLELSNNITVGNEALSIAGTGAATNGALRNLSGNNTYGGLVTLTGPATIQSDAGLLTLDVASGAAITGVAQNVTFTTSTGGGNITVADAITTTSGTLTTSGTGGTTTLQGVNTFSGATTIGAGTNLTIASAGSLNSGTYAAGITNNGTLQYSSTASQTLSGAITGTGAFIKDTGSASTVTFSGATANTYSGLTTVTAGTLLLSKTAGVDAIVGDGINSKVTPDVLINGGTLTLGADNQLNDSVFINLTSGTFNRSGKTETIYNFVNSGGTYNSGRGGSFTVIDPIWSGGTTDILSPESYGNLEVSGGANTIHGDEGFGQGPGTVTVGAGGLLFSGNASPTITVSSDNTAGGQLILNTDVTVSGTSGTASILQGNRLVDNNNGTWTNTGSLGTSAGTLSLGNAQRTFTVTNAGASLAVSTPITSTGTSGGITKAGAGTMTVSSTVNSYQGPTTVDQGTLAVTGSISGTSGVTINSTGTLLLNSAGTNVVGGGTATVNLNGGTLGNAQSTNTQSFGALTLGDNSILDFSAGNSNKFVFSSLASLGTTGIKVLNWSGTSYNVGAGNDDGTTDPTQDRFLFTNSFALSGYTNGQQLAQISFFNDGGSFIGTGQAISFGGGTQWEIVPVPEPATTALIGSVALCALIGYRERRRFTGVRSRLGRK